MDINRLWHERSPQQTGYSTNPPRHCNPTSIVVYRLRTLLVWSYQGVPNTWKENGNSYLLLNPTKRLPSSRGVCLRTQDSLIHLRKSAGQELSNVPTPTPRSTKRKRSRWWPPRRNLLPRCHVVGCGKHHKSRHRLSLPRESIAPVPFDTNQL